MRTVRRLYFYLVSLISLEVVLWGVIGLARNAANLTPGSTSVLARGLALVLVGLPVFLLHWSIAQREAFRDDDERASQVRAVFFYAALMSVLIPVVYAALAIIDRLFLSGLGLTTDVALAGRGQSAVDNLIAIAVNLAAWAYLRRVLRADWDAKLPGSSLVDVRRLYRYLWMLYGLVLLYSGARLVLYFLVYQPEGAFNPAAISLGNGLALLVIGAPLWVWTWLILQNSLDAAGERQSLLRLIILYLLALVGVVATLASAGGLLELILRRLLGEYQPFAIFLNNLDGFFATLVPAAVVWAYYSRQLSQELEAVPDEPRRAGLRRLYFYLLSVLGNVAVFGGAQQVLSVVVQIVVGNAELYFANLRAQLSVALAVLVIGLPLWLVTWTRMQAEAARLDDPGDHARRSAIRKGYLYLALFATVAGAMFSGGRLLYLVFTNLLGQRSPTFAVDAANWLQTLVLVLVWLVYHLRALRADGRLAQRSLGQRHAAFPALIVQADNESFTVELVQALQRLAPRLPIQIHRMDTGAPGEDLLRAKVVILPAWLAMKPGEALRLWLEEFKGARLLVPRSRDGWIWLGALPRGERDLARETAGAVRQLAEGQEVRLSPPTSPWAIAGYILGGIFALFLLIALFGAIMSSFR